jgi:hypothetical protein
MNKTAALATAMNINERRQKTVGMAKPREAGRRPAASGVEGGQGSAWSSTVRVSAGPPTIQPFRPENPVLAHSVGMASIEYAGATSTNRSNLAKTPGGRMGIRA